MTDDLSELKRLAEAVIARNKSLTAYMTMGATVSQQRDIDAWNDYIAAASPSAVLSLIARVEKAEARVKVLEKALKPFAQTQLTQSRNPDNIVGIYVGVAQIRAAATALGDTND